MHQYRVIHANNNDLNTAIKKLKDEHNAKPVGLLFPHGYLVDLPMPLTIDERKALRAYPHLA